MIWVDGWVSVVTIAPFNRKAIVVHIIVSVAYGVVAVAVVVNAVTAISSTILHDARVDVCIVVITIDGHALCAAWTFRKSVHVDIAALGWNLLTHKVGTALTHCAVTVLCTLDIIAADAVNAE